MNNSVYAFDLFVTLRLMGFLMNVRVPSLGQRRKDGFLNYLRYLLGHMDAEGASGAIGSDQGAGWQMGLGLDNRPYWKA